MRILLLAPQPFYVERGTPIAVKLLAQALSDDGCTIDLVCFNEGEDPEIPGVRLHRVGRRLNLGHVPPGFSLKKLVLDMILMFRAISLCIRRRYDVIHAVEESAFIAMLLSLFTQTPHIMDVDSEMSTQLIDKQPLLRPMRKVLQWLERLPTKTAYAIVACNDALATPLRQQTGKPVYVLKDVSLMPAPSGTQADPLADSVSSDDSVVLYIGNLERYQGVDLLMETFASISDLATQLVIVGGDDTTLARYRNKADTLGIKERSHFVGPQPLSDIGVWMARADVLVSPRIQGINTPMKIYSYLDSGTPVLATDLPTHTEILDDTIAMLAKPDVNEFANGLRRLLEQPDHASALAARAKAFVRREHSIDKFRCDVRSIYGSLFRHYPALAPHSEATVSRPG